MNRWKLVIFGTAVWSIINGLTLLFRHDLSELSTITWHKNMVGWAMLLSGCFTLGIRLFVEITNHQTKTNNLLWLELGMICGATSMRLPMAMSQAIDNHTSWAQTIGVCNFVLWSIITTLGLWVHIVIPGVEADRRRLQFDIDIRAERE